MTRLFISKIAFGLLVIAAPMRAQAQSTTASSTNAPGTNAPAAAAPAAVAVGDVAIQTEAVTAQLQQFANDLNPDTVLQDVDQKLPGLTSQVDEHVMQDARLLQGNSSLSLLQNSQAAWRSLSTNLSDAQKILSDRVAQMNDRLLQLQKLAQQWQATSNTAKNSRAPVDTVASIQQTLAAISATTKAVQADLNQLYSRQNSVAAQAARVTAGLDSVNKATQTAWRQLLQRDHPQLWSGASLTQPGGGLMSQERQSFQAQFTALNEYVDDKVGAIISQLLLITVLAMALHWLRNALRARATEEPQLVQTEQVLGVPVAMAVLLTLLISGWLYPAPPPLLHAALGAIALIPAVIIIRRLIEPPLLPLLFATVAAYVFDLVRFVIHPGGVLSRFLFLFELLAAAIFVLAALRSKKLISDRPGAPELERIVRGYLHVAFLAFVVAGFANALGYLHLSVLVGSDGMLQSSYDAVILYAGVRVLDALALSAMSVWPLSRLLMIRKHRDLLYLNTANTLRWAATLFWFYLALQNFKLFDPLWAFAGHALWKKHSWGSMQDIQLAPILAFPITIWASFLLSRFIRFCLEEEVYPYTDLPRGIPYAISTVVRYSVLVLGFFIALDALGVDLGKFTILAGAFGVGLGFGMQNIMNNFISGLILLFERPIKVGDTIQIDANTIGRVERIGIRASVIMLTNGSELIMPNGNLISNPVTNWTLSNCERVIELPVNVTSKADPHHVMELLVNVAKAHPDVIKNPAPQAVLTQPGIATQAYKLRAWIDAEDEWMRITSDLSLAINDALTKENISMA